MSHFILAGAELGQSHLSWKQVGHGCSWKGFYRYGLDASLPIWFICCLEEHDSFSFCWSLLTLFLNAGLSPWRETSRFPSKLTPETWPHCLLSHLGQWCLNTIPVQREGAWLHPPSGIKNRGLHGIKGGGRSQVQNKIQLEEVGLINRLI